MIRTHWEQLIATMFDKKKKKQKQKQKNPWVGAYWNEYSN